MMTPRPVRSRKRNVTTRAVHEEDWNARMLRYAALLALYAVLLLFVLFSWANVSLGGIAPFWVLGPVFVWSVRRPDLMPGAMLFLIGLLSDLVIGTPLGAHALGLLALATLARLQQRYLMTQNFIAIWADFGALSFLFSCVVLLSSLVAGGTFDAFGSTVLAGIISWLVLFLLFPPLALMAHALANLIQKSES